MPNVLHYKIIYFLSYAHPIYMKCLFKNIHKQWNMLESSLRFKKNTNFTIKQFENSYTKNEKLSGYYFYMNLNI